MTVSVQSRGRGRRGREPAAHFDTLLREVNIVNVSVIDYFVGQYGVSRATAIQSLTRLLRLLLAHPHRLQCRRMDPVRGNEGSLARLFRRLVRERELMDRLSDAEIGQIINHLDATAAHDTPTPRVSQSAGSRPRLSATAVTRRRSRSVHGFR